MAKVKHREVWVDLNGTDDRFTIMGRVTYAMKRVAVSEEGIAGFREEARKTKTIPELLAVCERWVTVERES